MKHKLLALAFAAGSSLHAQAAKPGESQALTSPDQVPQGLTAADWSSIRNALSAGYAANAAGIISQQAYAKPWNTGADDQFGYSVAVSGDTVVVGAPFEDSSSIGIPGSVANDSQSNSGAAYVFQRSAGTWVLHYPLKASNYGVSDNFGHSVAVSGDTIVVGALGEDSSTLGVNGLPNESATSSGAAYVFTRSGTSWNEQAFLKGSNTESGDTFGYSVAVSGDTIIVGAYGESSNSVGVNENQVNNNATLSGAAYVFARSGSAWSQQGYLKASNTGAFDIFGFSVAVSGDTAVVGAKGESSSTTGVNSIPNELSGTSGAAYVFTRSGGSWSQQAYLKASNTGVNDDFGRSVAVAGETIVVGAGREDSSTLGVGSVSNETASEAGAAYVFTRSGGSWNQQAYLKASNTQAGDNFGHSVAVSGETIVVGAIQEDSATLGVNSISNEAAINSGAAYVFTRSGSSWNQQAYLKAGNTGAFDFFGYSVAISGGTVISGASDEDSITTVVNAVPNDAGTANNSGAAYIFTLPVAEPPVVPPVLDKTAPLLVLSGKIPKLTKKAQLTFKGTASDASGIKSVQYRLGKGPRKFATGTTAWTFKTKLKKGLNTITLTATDTAGNISARKVIKIKRK
jgi:FG-GAP repeat/Bacterial Ig-like domain